MRTIELLAPARNLECGIEAIRHGADAVYIGAPRFGARAAAGNSIEDIASLVRYAHLFGVRIYVTLNTLLHDDEFPAVQTLINELASIHVDALITQDSRILPPSFSEGSLPPSSGLVEQIFVRSSLPLHSSTQMDNRTADDVRARFDAGYTQTVLARELSLEAIRAIHAAVPEMPLEVFVHGALCVSYSGRCYASEYCFGRSANRGECAQFCRLPFDLIDADGKVLKKQLHLLSLRDMNRATELEALMDAGASSFKIEGRLKDVSYVKNTTAYYRQRIDEIIARRPDDFCRSSYGSSVISFIPNVNKSFNRRFTDYFLHGRKPDMACFSTPKAIGEPVGHVKSTAPLAIAGSASFTNGDGLCFIDVEGRLQGFRVNRVDEHGYLYPADPSVLSLLRKGMPLYRNYDAAFERILSRPTAERRLLVCWLLEDTSDGFRLTIERKEERLRMKDTQAHPTPFPKRRSQGEGLFPYPHELARTPQTDNIRRQLSRLGDTPFITNDADITIHLSDNWFIPSSVLADWRRKVVDSLIADSTSALDSDAPSALPVREGAGCSESCISLSSKVTAPSRTGRAGGKSSGGVCESTVSATPLMTCRFCLLHALGACKHDGHRLPFREPLSLRLSDGRTFPLRFDCQRCEMQVL